MGITRRDVFKNIAKGSVVAGAAAVALPPVLQAEEPPQAPKEAVGMLYDATKCIGCKSCVVACSQANALQPDTRLDSLHQAPTDLNSFTKNIIKLYKPASGGTFSYVKQQCMHCLEPACISACMFGGLSKDKSNGIVSWNGTKCVGCRYCQVACPFNVPKFQWEKFNPRIVKCELCRERLADGKQPACTTVCPVNAVIYGKREELLAEAKTRIARNPGKYYQDRVYGETDGGGTQVIYLSHVPYENIGLPALGNDSIPERLKWQHRLYSYLALPTVLYAAMVGAMRGNWKHHQEELKEDQKKTGLRPQL